LQFVNIRVEIRRNTKVERKKSSLLRTIENVPLQQVSNKIKLSSQIYILLCLPLKEIV
jgi:hypothetical protein